MNKGTEKAKILIIILVISNLVFLSGFAYYYYSFSTLKTNYYDLKAKYDILESSYNNLKADYDNLKSQYNLLLSILVSKQSGFEMLEITSSYAITTSDGWKVYVTVKNTGSTYAIITSIMINGISNDNWWPAGSLNPALPQIVNIGDSATFTITLRKGYAIGPTTLTSGITLTIVIHTIAGKDYPTSITLP